MKPEIPEVENDVHHSVSVYGADAMDDFPVLKAFQQYIDAEQARARKRLLTLGVFFGVLMLVVISVFVVMLYGAGQRNQVLNDRLIEFAMKERDRDRQAAVVVQPPVQQDNSAILALTAKMEELQHKLAASQKIAEDAEKARAAAVKAAAAASTPKGPSAEQLEIQRLKALLAAEKERKAAEASRRRQEELEAYRRKHYPELYEKPKAPEAKKVEVRKPKSNPLPKIKDEVIDDVGDVELDDDDAIDYFKEETSPTGEKSYSIPVDVKGSKGKWLIPDE
jgi:hypothetical protein